MVLFSKIFLVRSSTLLALFGASILLPLGAAGMERDVGVQIKEEFSSGVALARRLVEEGEVRRMVEWGEAHSAFDPTFDLLLIRNTKLAFPSRVQSAKNIRAHNCDDKDAMNEAGLFLTEFLLDPQTSSEDFFNVALTRPWSDGERDRVLATLWDKIQDPTIEKSSERLFQLSRLFTPGYLISLDCPWLAKQSELFLRLSQDLSASPQQRSKARDEVASAMGIEVIDVKRYQTNIYPIWEEMAGNIITPWSDRIAIRVFALRHGNEDQKRQALSSLQDILQNPEAPAESRCDAAIQILEQTEEGENGIDILTTMVTNLDNSPDLRLEAARRILGTHWLSERAQEEKNLTTEELLAILKTRVLSDAAPADLIRDLRRIFEHGTKEDAQEVLGVWQKMTMEHGFASLDFGRIVGSVFNHASGFELHIRRWPDGKEEGLEPFVRSIISQCVSRLEGMEEQKEVPDFLDPNIIKWSMEKATPDEDLKVFPHLLNVVRNLQLSQGQRCEVARWIVGIVDRTEQFADDEGRWCANTGLEPAFSAFLDRKLALLRL